MAYPSSFERKLTTARNFLAAAASLAATVMFARSVARDILPNEFQEYISSGIRSFLNSFTSQVTIIIDEFDGLVNNHVYEAVEIYLGDKISPNTRRFKVCKSDDEHNFTITMDRNEEISDVFDGVKFRWLLTSKTIAAKKLYNPRDNSTMRRSEVRSFELSFHGKHKDMVLNSYLPYIVKEANSIAQKTKALKIFTLNDDIMYRSLSDLWESTNLDHPATFETLAMESDVKNFILKDLEKFVKRKEYYKKVGKAWKRGYLLFGPPGTGKSSLIAAMANYLNFDIYDLELSELQNSLELRRLLISMANRSILVVEDIDCSIKFRDRHAEEPKPQNNQQKQVTLSGLLNFIDGLWSSCGDERIIVFTTNHKEKLDPALLRPGRMDVHVLLSYCTPCGFRTLAANYLEIKDHALFAEIEESIGAAQVTPAEVAEVLMRNEDPDVVLRQLIEFFEGKKKAEGKEKKEAQANSTGTDQHGPGTQGPLAIESVEKKEEGPLAIERVEKEEEAIGSIEMKEEGPLAIESMEKKEEAIESVEKKEEAIESVEKKEEDNEEENDGREDDEEEDDEAEDDEAEDDEEEDDEEEDAEEEDDEEEDAEQRRIRRVKTMGRASMTSYKYR